VALLGAGATRALPMKPLDLGCSGGAEKGKYIIGVAVGVVAVFGWGEEGRDVGGLMATATGMGCPSMSM
jgi:hypothetical protein